MKQTLRSIKTFFLSRGPFRSRGPGAYVARSTYIDYRCNVSLGARTHISDHCRLIPGAGEISIGDDTLVHPFVVMGTGGGGGVIRIGSRCAINSFSCLYGLGGLDMGDDVMLAPGVVIVAQTHNFERDDIPIKDQGSSGLGVRIGNGVWIASRAVILDGVTVGEGAIIGAGAVVIEDVDPFDVVQGNPARVVRNRKEQP